MSSSQDRTRNDSVATEAAEWFIDLQGAATHEQQQAFADWLCRSPVHIEEFLQLTALQGDLARLPDLKNADLTSLLASGSFADVPGNVVPWALPKKVDSSQPMQPRKRERVRIASAAAVAAAIVLAVGLYSPIRGLLNTERYATDVGEQRSLTLTDGSHVQLNVRSNLSAKLSETARDVRLEEGEALFNVAKDPARPFRVRTPQATIEAIGTQFNVDVKRGATVVTLLEGRVEVTSSRNAKPVRLEPGEALVIDAHRVNLPAPQIADLKSATAWLERRLVFEDATLADVVSEFNRYSRQPLVIEDSTLRDARITASFESGSVQNFADSLAIAGRLRVTHQTDGSWLIERREQ